jgi:hypothetical protein
MPVDYYFGKSIAELSKLLTALQARKAAGNVTEVLAAGVRTYKDYTGNNDLDKSILDVRWSLYLRAQQVGDDDAKALYTNPYLERVRATVGDFYKSNSPR